AGFVVRIEQRSTSGCNPVPEGDIMSQDPLSDSQVALGSQVAIRVSSGKGPLGIILGAISAFILLVFSYFFILCPNH
ncbi:MAG: PASTA domain-containing protein, partial [Candidatus Hydrogenedentes bacterium]|nr:PASTA domain-containing protein [Candidatus Hydrogenedentota bacterium]